MKQKNPETIAHDQLTNARPVPEQWQPAQPPFPPLYKLSMTFYGMGYPFGQLGSAVPAVPPPSSLCTPSLLAGGVSSRKGFNYV